MQSMDAEFSPPPEGRAEMPEDDVTRIKRITELAARRKLMLDELAMRARAAERDINHWFAHHVAQTLKTPWYEERWEPPRSIFDVEPPF